MRVQHTAKRTEIAILRKWKEIGPLQDRRKLGPNSIADILGSVADALQNDLNAFENINGASDRVMETPRS